MDILLIFFSLFPISSSDNAAPTQCRGGDFLKYLTGNVDDADPPIPFKFIFIEDPDPNEMYEHGIKFQVDCPQGMDFAYHWESRSLVCDNGEISQDDVSSFNHCIKYSQCSAASFYTDWVIKGYRLSSKIKSVLKDTPLISGAMSYSESIKDLLKQYGKLYPRTILSQFSSDTPSHNTYPSLLLLECDIGYTMFTIFDYSYKPHAYCLQKKGQKKAKWSVGRSSIEWKKLHSSCTKIIQLSIRSSPPPQGCTVLSDDRADCMIYKKYCAWDELKKFKNSIHFDSNKVDLRICTQTCLPWSCLSALTMPIDCNLGSDSARFCTKLVPALTYWCQWDIKEKICTSKRLEEQSKDYTIKIDVCSTDKYKCRLSQDNDWWDAKNIKFNGHVEKLTIKFGYKYLIFGVRHVVEVSSLSEMRGSVMTTIRATHQIDDNDPTQISLDAPVHIEPNEIIKKFGLLTRTKYSVLSKLFDLSKLSSKIISSSKPNPEYNYISIELKSDEMELNSPPISFYLTSYSSKDCHRCRLEKYPGTAKGSRINTITNILYVADIGDPSSSIVRLQNPRLTKSNIKLTGKIEIEPGPERCGKNDLGCFISFEPIMNDVASSLIEFKCSLPIRARLGGHDSSLLTVFGVEPSSRTKVVTKYEMKISKTKEFTAFNGQTATLRWSVDIGLVKSIVIKTDSLPEWSIIVQKPIKIEFKSFDDVLKTRPDKTKWVFLTAKKSMHESCDIQTECYLCGIEISPKIIKIRKGFSRTRIKVTPRTPGNFQIHFSVIGECADLVSNPPSLLVEVFRPDAGFVKVPEELTIINGEWSEDVTISITRPPFRTELVIKPLTNEFQTNPLELEFDNIKRTVIQTISTSMNSITFNKDIQIRPSLECGGGPPRELKWTLSGAIDEFYTPTSTMVNVLTADDDEDFCKYKQYEALMNSSNGTDISFGSFIFDADKKSAEKLETENIPTWRFEYYLIGGSITIIILVITDQFKNQKFDKMIAVMASGLQP